jgi:mRNA deadenylase 3'-5' endonuclease subunit Ccr4
LYGDPSYLANAIYVSNKLQTLPKDSNKPNKINERGLERCFSMSVVQLNGKPIKIVSVHLIGGRFDDIEAIQDESYYTEKLNQIKQVVSNNPDIICGDFNTKFRTPEITDNTNKYFNTILEKIIGHPISEKARKTYESRWDKWIYMDSIHEYLTQNGYKSVYYSDSGELQIHISDTSAFGGIVDMIYYKSDTLAIKPNSVEVVGDGIVMEKNFSQIYRPLLSDHFPIKATFELVL